MAPQALLQVFRNLTTNAIRSMSPGGTLHLSARSDLDRLAVRAVVADTGPGPAPAAPGHFFKPFFTTKAVGTAWGWGCPWHVRSPWRTVGTCSPPTGPSRRRLE